MSRDALVVGINAYSYEGLNNLKAPAQDAEAVAQLLEKYGDFKVTRLPAVKDRDNKTIKIGQTSRVSLKKLRQAIVQLFLPSGNPPDTALLYFSGHGLRDELGVSEGFLATSDIDPSEDKWGVSLKWLREVLQKSEVKQQIIILDCCYSGELLNFTEVVPGDRGKGRDRCFIAASRLFEVAYEEIDNQHSVFTTALLKGLEPLQDKWVTNYTLVDKLNQEHHSFPQRPIFGNSGETINLTRRWTEASQKSTASSTDVCPYKGLRYFDCVEEDAKFFYGRTALTDELLEKVRVGKFLAVLGASGSGKSSVVRAGLLYQLTLGRRISGSEKWFLKIFKPGERPLQSLALAFLDTELSGIERASQLAKAEDLIAKGADGLRQLVNSLVIDDTQRLVLVVDQFEEAFTLCKDNEERQQFFDCLLGALQQCDDKLCLVLTMRSDFFGKCTEQEYSGLAQQIQQNLVTVTPMTRDELKKAIVEPANLVELKIEPELVEEMLLDVANAPGTLPLLQDTLTELWKNHSDNCLRLNTYAQQGGVMGTLRQRATKVYESFDKEEQAVCKHIFLALTQLGEGTEDTRRRCFKQDLVNKHYSEELIDKVIQRLADEKLIVTREIITKGSTSERVAVVDVAHEALIRHWTLLGRWIGENRDKLRQKRKIESAAEEWRYKGKSKDYLLTGKQLREAKAFQLEVAESLSLSQLATEFIIISGKQQRVRLLQTSSILIIPILIAAGIIVPYQRKQSYNQAWESIRSRKEGTRSALELLTEGCWAKDIPIYSLFFGKCHNLVGAKLNGANFIGAKLNGANLRNADLRNSNLRNSNLRNADLIGADLINAKLNGADLINADLIGADLRNAKLNCANFIGADLSYANFIGAKLNGANFIGAKLNGAKLNGAKFWNADLSYANFIGAKLNGADLSSANFTIKFWNADTIKFWNADFSGVNLRNAKLSNADLSNADLSNADLSNADLSNADLSNADLSNADFNNAYLNNADLSGADLSGADLRNTMLKYTELKYSLYNKETKFPKNFNPANQNMYLIAPETNLKGANLRNANLRKADLRNADLSNADLGSAIIWNAKLHRADIINADLSEAKYITPEQIKQAKNWEKAIYSPEFCEELGLPPEE